MTFNNTNECWDQQEESLKTDKQKKNLSQINSLTLGSTTAKPFHVSAISQGKEGPC